MINRRYITGVVMGALALFLFGCDDPVLTVSQAAIEPTREDMGHYCHMIVIDHPGPKGQIYLTNKAEPIWFSSVRDTIAFTLLPEEARNIAAVYVNDVAKMGDWARPDAGSWMKAKDAVFVIGSAKRGGMGALETVPFSDRLKADAFAKEFGGSVVAYADIPNDYVFGEAVPVQSVESHNKEHENSDAHKH